MDDSPSGRPSLLRELKRRRVFRVAGVSAVVAWVVIEAASTIFPALQLPEWTVTFVTILAVLGFPVAVVIAWAFEMTPDGLRRTPSATGEEAAADGAADGSVEGAARAAGEGAPSVSRSRASAFVGLGILIAIVGVGAYATLDGGRDAPGGVEAGSTVDGAGPPRAGARSIAVLPFDNLSADEDNTFFASGVHEDVLTQLALIEDLAVISRTSVLKYADADSLSIPEIGRELGVAYILEGSVRRAGDRVRVTAQLIDARSDEHLWANNYDRTLDDIFSVQSELALEIARSLEAELSGEERRRIEDRPTENMAAYDLYLRARELSGTGAQATETAIELYRQAIQLDSAFAHAYAGLAGAYMNRVQFYGHPRAWADSGIATARHALAIDPELAAAHNTVGTNATLLGRLEEAARAFRRTLELNPNSAAAMNNLGSLERDRGRLAEAIRLLLEADRLDPASGFPAANLGMSYWLLGMDSMADRWVREALARDFAEPGMAAWAWAMTDAIENRPERARARADSLLLTAPGSVTSIFTAALIAGWTDDWEGARRHFRRLYELAPDASYGGRLRTFRTYYAIALARTGEEARAAALLDTALVTARRRLDAGDETVTLREEMAAIHAIRGDTAAALDWLERAYDSGAGIVHRFIEVAPAYDAVRGSERYRRIRARGEREIAAMRREAAALVGG